MLFVCNEFESHVFKNEYFQHLSISAYASPSGGYLDGDVAALFLIHWYRLYPFRLKEVQHLLNNSFSEYSVNLTQHEQDLESNLAGGGCCPVRGSFSRFFFEIVPNWLCDYKQTSKNRSQGEKTSAWRKHRESPYSRTRFNKFHGRLGMLLNEEDELVLLEAIEAAQKQRSDLASLGGILKHLKIRGYESATSSCRNQLPPDLLPCERECLPWAIERERKAGGVQMFNWIKLPGKVYFSPVLNKITLAQPTVVHGGILGASEHHSPCLSALIQNNPPRVDFSSTETFPSTCSGTLLIVSFACTLRLF